MTTPIVDFVRRYAQSGTARLHMPGHKGQSLLGCEPWDITEIRGADELYEAEGIIAQSEANATRLFGTAHTYYSTEVLPSASGPCSALLCRVRPAPASVRCCWRPAMPTKPCSMRRLCWTLTSGALARAGGYRRAVQLPGNGAGPFRRP